VIGKCNNKLDITQKFMKDGKEFANPEEIANEFCNYFTEIGPKFAKAINAPNHNFSHYLSSRKTINPDSIYLSPTDENEVSNILKQCKPKTSSGHDCISTKLLKSLNQPLAYPISAIINKSIETGQVPESLKKAKVIVIYKSKNKEDFSNYRPISLLPSISKIMEKVIHKRLMHFLEIKHILYTNQFGFRKHRSTIDAVTKLLTDLASDMDNKTNTSSVFLDLSKAFDTIDHNILLSKLEFYGVRGIALDWFRSYLQDRTQYVEYIGATSRLQNIECGVPQGSVLGPLLFIIYTNDLPDVLKFSKTILFADDTTIYKSSDNLSNLYTNVNTDVCTLSEWFKANRLSLNVTKTNYILFKTKKTAHDYKLTICGQQIAQCRHTKFLGIHIDEKLKWSEHITAVSNKLSRAIFAINKATKQNQYYLYNN
jgi:hypothetical protein